MGVGNKICAVPDMDGRGIIDGRQFTVTWYVSLPPVIDEEVCVVA